MNQLPNDLLAGWPVLIVDDEEDSLEVASFILGFYGAEVHIARNGREGLAVARQVRPEFILSDLSMPDMDGWEMLRELSMTPATQHIPVIALTAHAMRGDRERAIGAGFHNYLTKPLTAKTFIHQLLLLLLDVPEFNTQLSPMLNADSSVQ